MNPDLTELLESWPYQGNEGVQARLVRGRDGATRVQLRVELGMMQMELHGRPDGACPHGHESLLHFHRAELHRHVQETGSPQGFGLGPEDCEALRRESLQYYHRRICLLELGMYDLAERDATRNLEVLDLLRDHANRAEDARQSEPYRAFILSHQVMARAMALAHDGQLRAALRAVDAGLESVRTVLQEQERGDRWEECDEIEFLQHLRDRLRRGRYGRLKDRLERELEAAVEREDYETAAQLRDKLRDIP